MQFDNDNSAPAPETSRVLPILGCVGADGRVLLYTPPPPSAEVSDWSPNDPREA